MNSTEYRIDLSPDQMRALRNQGIDEKDRYDAELVWEQDHSVPYITFERWAEFGAFIGKVAFDSTQLEFMRRVGIHPGTFNSFRVGWNSDPSGFVAVFTKVDEG